MLRDRFQSKESQSTSSSYSSGSCKLFGRNIEYLWAKGKDWIQVEPKWRCTCLVQDRKEAVKETQSYSRGIRKQQVM